MDGLDSIRLRRAIAGGSLVLVGSVLGGCVYRIEKETTPAAASPASTVVVTTTPQRTVTYPEGRYELYGDGTRTPYYWVWVPVGANPPKPPPPPRP